MNDVQMGVIIVGLIAALREQFPKIDGKAVVSLAAMVVGVGLSLLVGGDSVRNLVLHGLIVAMTAVGGMHVVSYHATKSAAGDGVPSDSPASDGALAKQRGFVSTATLLWMCGIALVAMAALVISLSGCGASKAQVKSVVDEAKTLVDTACSPNEPTLDGCFDKVIDRILSDPRYTPAKRAAALRRLGDAGVWR